MSGAGLTAGTKIGEYATWTIRFEPNGEVKSGSKLKVVLPYWDALLIGSSGADPKHMIAVANPSCKNGSTTLTCSYT